MQELTYVPLETIQVARPVDRLSWIVAQVKNLTVLDLGAYDETALHKMDSPFWLHGRISKVAKKVIGIDNAQKLPEKGIQTSHNSYIHKADIFVLPTEIVNQDVDVIVAGEFIEHLSDTSTFFKNFKKNTNFTGKRLILTTPNATSLHNVLLGLLNKESSHIDHLQVYSYKTLNTLCKRAGFTSWNIIPYNVSFQEMALKSTGMQRHVVLFVESMVNMISYVFPLLSGGWIVDIRI